MKRNWPRPSNNAIAVRVQPSLFATIITGFFSVIMIFVLPLYFWAMLNDKLPEEPGVIGYIIVSFFLSLFAFIAVGSFVSSIRNHFNPSLRLLANDEGMFLDVYVFFSGGKSFFASWSDIIKITQIDVEMGTGDDCYTDIAISIILSETKSKLLPKAIKGIGSTANSVAFERRMIDIDFDELLNKLQRMHNIYKDH